MAKREMKTNNVEETKVEVAAPVEKKEDNVTGSIVTGTVVANGYDKLNIRKAPKAGSDVITAINVGTKVKILDIEKAVGDWYKVKVDNGSSGCNGYCMKKYIKLD